MNTQQDLTLKLFASLFGNLFSLKNFLSLFLSQKLPMNIVFRKKIVFQQAMNKKSGTKTKKNRGAQCEKLAKRGIEITAVDQKVQQTYRGFDCKAIFPSIFNTGS